MLTAPVYASRSHVRQRRSGDEQGTTNRGGAQALRLRPLLLLYERRDHRVGAVMTGVRIRCAARSLTGGMRVNVERYQRDRRVSR